jgi:hypothetical protein
VATPNRRQLYRYKGDRCAHCGLSVQEMMDRYGDFQRLFEFNHVDPSKKRADYRNLIRRVISTEQLDELDKCVLLCRLCHGVVHQQNVRAEVVVSVWAGEHSCEQRLKGQLIHDRKRKTATFLTDEKVLLHPYRVYAGDAAPRILFGTELRNGQMAALMRKIDAFKTLRVSSWSDDPLVDIVSAGNGKVVGEVNIAFPVFSFELYRDAADPVFLWIRHGIGLTRTGDVIHGGVLKYEGGIPKTLP